MFINIWLTLYVYCLFLSYLTPHYEVLKKSPSKTDSRVAEPHFPETKISHSVYKSQSGPNPVPLKSPPYRQTYKPI